jgi:hypothetical protein
MLQKLDRKLRTIQRLWRDDRRRLLRIVLGDLSIYHVHSAELAAINPPREIPGMEFRPVSPDTLQKLAAEYPDMAYQGEALKEVGTSSAYAVFKHGRFASICWLMTEELDRRMPLRLVRLRAGEVEIAKAYTLPEFRGQGLYPFAIQSLCRAAHIEGARRVFMITKWRNAVSRRGIEKAGLRPLGWIIEVEPPIIGTVFRPVLRLFRMRLWGKRQLDSEAYGRAV